MNAIVSQDVCIGCGLCTSTVDEAFRMNDDGKAEGIQYCFRRNKGCCTGGNRIPVR